MIKSKGLDLTAFGLDVFEFCDEETEAIAKENRTNIGKLTTKTDNIVYTLRTIWDIPESYDELITRYYQTVPLMMQDIKSLEGDYVLIINNGSIYHIISSGSELTPHLIYECKLKRDAIDEELEALNNDLNAQIENGYLGKNLISVDDLSVSSGSGSTDKVLTTVNVKAGTYTLSWEQSATVSTSTRNTPMYKLNGGSTVPQSSNTNYNQASGKHSWTFTLDQDGVLELHYWIHTPSTSVTYSKFQLEIGTEATSYADYVPSNAELKADLTPQTANVTLESGYAKEYGSIEKINGVVYLNFSIYRSNDFVNNDSVKVGTLPVGYRPKSLIGLALLYGRITINTNGDIEYTPISSTTRWFGYTITTCYIAQ